MVCDEAVFWGAIASGAEDFGIGAIHFISVYIYIYIGYGGG